MKKLIQIVLAGMLFFSMTACSQPASSTGLKDGTYTVVTKGMDEGLTLDVTFAEGKIAGVKVVSHNETAGVSDPAIERMPEMIVANNSVNVDAVAGATMTSNGILDGVKKAIEEAGGKVEDFNTAADQTAKQEEVTMEADVVIAGAGLAGLTTAVSAAENGLDVIVVEKMPRVGGSLALAMGSFFSVNSEIAKAAGVEDSKEHMMDIWHQIAEYGPDASDQYPNFDRISYILDETGPQLSWLQDHGVQFNNVIPSAGTHPVMITTDNGAAVAEKLEAAAKAAGVQILTDTPAVELITEEGKVVGLKAASTTQNLTIKAPSVVLATGGFGNNLELMDELIPQFNGSHLQTAVGNVGDGLAMAEAVGGVVYDHCWALVTGITVSPAFLGAAAEAATINLANKAMVDQTGKRYVSEVSDLSIVPNALAKRESKSFVLCDSSDPETVKILEQGLTSGAVFKADTIEELAKAAEIDATALQETFDRYNASAAAGVDEEFEKPADSLIAYGEGPYYAVQCVADIIGTYGGVKTDFDSHVLDKDGNPIEGLYALGEMSNREYYNEAYMACASLTMYSTVGRLLGQNLAAQAK